jgi:hypothetical protein
MFNVSFGTPNATNFLETLLEQGLIQSPSFSLWTDNYETTQGSLLFGGVNTAKYHGPLQTAPMLPPEYGEGNSGFLLPAGELILQDSSDSKSDTEYQLNGPVELDISNSLTVLPNDTVLQLWKELNISSSTDYTPGIAGSLPCYRKHEDRNISITLGGSFTLTATWSDLIQTVIERNTNKSGCSFSIWPGNFEGNISGFIGNPFLNHTYLVVDYENSLVGVAPLNTNPGPDNILQIGNGSSQTGFPTSTPTSTTAAAASTSSSAALALNRVPVAFSHLVPGFLFLVFAAF